MRGASSKCRSRGCSVALCCDCVDVHGPYGAELPETLLDELLAASEQVTAASKNAEAPGSKCVRLALEPATAGRVAAPAIKFLSALPPL